jgi:hypothetical protein
LATNACPLWIEVVLVSICFLALGTREETYLALYAAGVFILLSMTGWAAAKRLIRDLRTTHSLNHLPALTGTSLAAFLTSGATVIIFVERFLEGAWIYIILVPILYVLFGHFRSKLGEPRLLEEHLGRFFVGQYLLPFERDKRPENETRFSRIVVPLDGTLFAEHAIAPAEVLARCYHSNVTIVTVKENRKAEQDADEGRKLQAYLDHIVWQLKQSEIQAGHVVKSGSVS